MIKTLTGIVISICKVTSRTAPKEPIAKHIHAKNLEPALTPVVRKRPSDARIGTGSGNKRPSQYM